MHIGLIVGLRLFALFFGERRAFIIDTNRRIFTLIKKRAFSTREESIAFERAERFEFLPHQARFMTQNSLHLIHDQGMLQIFGQDRQRMPIQDAEHIAHVAGLKLKRRTR